MKKFQRFLVAILAVALFVPPIISANTPTEPCKMLATPKYTTLSSLSLTPT